MPMMLLVRAGSERREREEVTLRELRSATNYEGEGFGGSFRHVGGF